MSPRLGRPVSPPLPTRAQSPLGLSPSLLAGTPSPIRPVGLGRVPCHSRTCHSCCASLLSSSSPSFSRLLLALRLLRFLRSLPPPQGAQEATRRGCHTHFLCRAEEVVSSTLALPTGPLGACRKHRRVPQTQTTSTNGGTNGMGSAYLQRGHIGCDVYRVVTRTSCQN